MASADTLLGVLELVHAAGQRIDSRIRVQKEAFLLACLGLGRFHAKDFSYHHFGPYSREVSDSLHRAVLLNFLDETVEEPEDGSYIKYSYELTESGKDFVAKEGGDVDAIVPCVRKWSKKSWRSLELAATVRYLEITNNKMDRDAALNEAMRLKPATVRYSEEAKSVLADLK